MVEDGDKAQFYIIPTPTFIHRNKKWYSQNLILGFSLSTHWSKMHR